MDPSSKIAGSITPTKEKTARSRPNETLRNSENLNPNLSSPGLKFSGSTTKIKLDKSAKKVAATPSAKKKIRERKFVVIAKKKSRNNDEESTNASTSVICEKCRKTIGKSKCLCVAYESLRASQEEFYKCREDDGEVSDELKVLDDVAQIEGTKSEIDNGVELRIEGKEVFSGINLGNKLAEAKVNVDMGVKRSRDRLLEEVRESKPVRGCGKVMNLVEEFEKLSVINSGDSEQKELKERKNEENNLKWRLPGLQQPPKVLETQVSDSFCASDFFLTSESLGLDLRRSYSLDSSRGSISTMTSAGGRRSRRNSSDSTGNRSRRHWKRKQLKATSQKPFTLRTEERGRCKEEEFMKKLQKMLEEEEKLRIPIAQGLPWTTDEPECLVKPPIKEITRPVDLVLHTDMRAVDRSEFEEQVAKKMSLIEQYRRERVRLQKMAEEEEIRRLRKELVPKAQPMPYFDRPFIPQKSSKHPTKPKEPKFHMPEHKKIKCYLSSDSCYNSSSE